MEAGYANDTISVIVPVYNSEKRLERCIASLVNQTYQNLQIILVDDGSKDHSGSICDAWGEKDNRITVLHQSNGGVSKARNTGLDVACGEYVAFVDSDDYISEEMFQLLITTAYTCQADQVCCNTYDVVFSDIRPQRHAFNNKVIDQNEIFDQLIVPLVRPEMAGSKASLLQPLWNKLYLRRIIEDHHIRFDTELTYAEDWLFNVNFYRFAKCVAFIPEHLYFYDRSTEGSLSKKFRWEGFEQSVKLRSYEKEWFPDFCTDQEYHALIFRIHIHFLKNYCAHNGYRGFGKYARYLLGNNTLKAVYSSAVVVPKSHVIIKNCFKENGHYVFIYILWAVLQTGFTALKFYVKNTIRCK